jgi:hypothetical protein
MGHGLPFGGQTCFLFRITKLLLKHKKHTKMKRRGWKELPSKPQTIFFYG